MKSTQALEKIHFIAKNKSLQGIKQLIEFLAHENWIVRKNAARALLALKDDSFDYILEAFDSPNEDKRYWAIKILGNLGEKGAEELINKIPVYLKKKELAFIIEALANTGSDKVIPYIINLLKHESWNIRKAAAEALFKIGKKTLPYLKKAFKSKNRDLRFWSIKLMGQLLSEKIIPVLKESLKSEDRDTRYYSIIAISEIRTDLAVSVLIEALKDPSWIIRRQAAYALCERGKEIVDYLIKAFSTGNSDQKYWIIQILSRVLKSKALPFLEKLILSGDEEIKYHAITALATIRITKSVKLLIKALNDNVWMVRSHAAEQLIALGKKTINIIKEENILEEGSEDIKYWLIKVLARLNEIKPLKEMFEKEDTSKKTKIHILNALEGNDDEQAIQIILSGFIDKDWPVRFAAKQALSAAGAAALDYLIEFADEEVLENKDGIFWVGKLVSDYQDIAVKYLTKIFKTKGRLISNKAVKIFSTLQNIEFVKQIFKKGFNKEDDVVNFWFSRLLSFFVPCFKEEIIRYFYSELTYKRVWILRACARAGDLTYQKEVIACLNDREKEVRLEAIKVLGVFGTKEGISALIEKLYQNDKAESEAAKLALIESEPFVTIDMLVSHIKSADKKTCEKIVEILKAFGGEFVDVFIEFYKGAKSEKQKICLVKSLDGYLPDKVFKFLIEQLKSLTEFSELRFEILKLLFSTGPLYVVKEVCDILPVNKLAAIEQKKIVSILSRKKLSDEFYIVLLRWGKSGEVKFWLDEVLSKLRVGERERIVEAALGREEILTDVRGYILNTPLEKLKEHSMEELIEMIALATKVRNGFIQTFIVDYGKEYVIRAAKECLQMRNYDYIRSKADWLKNKIETIKGFSSVSKKFRKK